MEGPLKNIQVSHIAAEFAPSFKVGRFVPQSSCFFEGATILFWRLSLYRKGSLISFHEWFVFLFFFQVFFFRCLMGGFSPFQTSKFRAACKRARFVSDTPKKVEFFSSDQFINGFVVGYKR